MECVIKHILIDGKEVPVKVYSPAYPDGWCELDSYPDEINLKMDKEEYLINY